MIPKGDGPPESHPHVERYLSALAQLCVYIDEYVFAKAKFAKAKFAKANSVKANFF